MREDDKPIFRSRFVPWYDRGPLCAFLLAAMAVVAAFGATGAAVAWKNPLYIPYLWVPCLVTGLSGGVMISVLARLILRGRERDRAGRLP